MAIPTFNAVGFAAHYSKQGDWAFDYALQLSKRCGLKLNVFHFLQDPYNPDDNSSKNLNLKELDELAIKEEKQLRLYYDELAGEFLDVGFRVCYDKSWTELHRCLLIREFQVLVLGYPEFNATFVDNTIEHFAQRFISPVVLVGPHHKDQFFLNRQALHISDKLGIDSDKLCELNEEIMAV